MLLDNEDLRIQAVEQENVLTNEHLRAAINGRLSQ